ncbi:MAG TPA: GGDEF domain-containing protein [Pseudonocardiaceae bacterium]|nr:GGDEF domain-containing protein [Pseudonocardiaceae bacterium]
MPEISVDTRFAFQPLINLHTGGVVAIEMLARPMHQDVQSLLRSAAHAGDLEKLDVTLAVAAARYSSEHETLLPLHLNLMVDTVIAEDETLVPLHQALNGTARQVSQTVLEINPSDTELKPELLFAGLHRLRQLGYRVALDGVGAGNYPLRVIAEARPELIKMDREIVAGLPGDSSCVAVLEALQHLAVRIGAQVVAEGVERPEQLATLRQCGVGIAQGNLFAPPSRRPQTFLTTTGIAEFRAPAVPAPTLSTADHRITDFMHPAVTLPLSATGEEVRAVLSDRPAINGVVLVDTDGRPYCTLERNRFLLAVSGAYGHALYSRREAARLGDKPRVLEPSSSALAALELVRSSVAHRRYDDIVVVDAEGRCAGQVCIGDVIQGMARLTIEQGATLHPLTRLPGSDLVAQLVDRKVAESDAFTVSWLDVDDLGAVNNRSGFAAGDDLIRELGRALTEAGQTFPSAAVAHIGADDFVVITDPEDVMPLGSGVLDEPWEVDGCEVTLSLASLICSPGTVAGHRDVSRMLARLHRHAKSMPATSWVSGRTSSDRVEVVRGDTRVTPVA